MQSCWKTKKECCICYQQRAAGVVCTKCVSGIVCIDCASQLCENGQCERCPVCRRKNWKNNVMPKNIVVPKGTAPGEIRIANNLITDADEFECSPYRCKKTLDQLVVCISLAFSAYMIGIFTILVFASTTSELLKPQWCIIPLLIGLVEFKCLTCCCWKCVIKPDYD